ncbi:hypothetical protein pdam_00018812, partial [Pocillopora damicornis]
MLFKSRITEEDLTIMTKLAQGHFEKVIIILKQLPRSMLLVFRFREFLSDSSSTYVPLEKRWNAVYFKNFHSRPIGNQFWTFFCSAIAGIHGHSHEFQSVDGGKLPTDSLVPSHGFQSVDGGKLPADSSPKDMDKLTSKLKTLHELDAITAERAKRTVSVS